MSEKVGLLVGVGFYPSESEFKILLNNGDLVSGLEYVTIELTEHEAGDERFLTTMFQGAAAKKGWPQGIHAEVTIKNAKVNGKPVVTVFPSDSSPMVGQAGREISSKEICWFCNENQANPSSSVQVKVERQTFTSRTKYKEEWKQLAIPRCQRCASLRKKDTRENAIIAIPAMLAGLGTCVLVGILSNTSQPEWVAYVSGGCVSLVLFTLGIIWVFRQRGKMPEAEKKLLEKLGTYDVKTHPLVAIYIKEGFKVVWQKD